MDNRGELIQIDKLTEWEHNPRNINTTDFARLKSQIEQLGMYKPLLAMQEGERYIVLGGNMRLKALQEIKPPAVWISKIDFILDPNDNLWHAFVNGQESPKRFQQKEDGMMEYALSDNDRAGYYDDDLLANLIPNLNVDWSQYAADLNPPTNLQDIINKFKEAEEDEAPAVSEETPVSKLGEIYQLGEHKLMCGDSTNQEHVKRLMDVPADMIFTDPPYNVNYSGQGKNTSNTIKNDHMDNDKFEAFLTEAFKRMKEVSRDNTPAYICYASSTHREFENALNLAGYEVRNQIIWVKKVASMGWGDYRWKHEPILYVKPKGGSPEFFGDREQYTEWSQEMADEDLLKLIKKMVQKDESGGSTVWRLHRDSDYQHPTQKPLQLIVIALKNSSTPGDVVLDLFGGSGSTLIACEQTSRKSRLMELDPKYCDVIRKRYAKFLKQEDNWEQLTPKVDYVETNEAVASETTTPLEVQSQPEQANA